MVPARYSVTRATLFVAVSACCFGSLTTLTLLGLHAGLPLTDILFWRFSLASGFLFVITWRARKEYRFDSTAWRLVGIGAVAQAAISYLSFRALDYLPVGVLAFLFYTYPAWVAIISALRGREKFTVIRLVALTLAMTGIAVMISAPKANALSTIGIAIALGTALLYALYLPMINDAQRQLPAFVASFYLVTGMAISFLVISIVTGNLKTPQTLNAWGLLFALSIIGTVLAFGSLMAGLRTLGPVRTSIVSTVEPFFTAILGAAILKQGLTIAIIGGGILIAAAVAVLATDARTETNLEQSPNQ